jgi:hypothetical protein
MLLEFHQYPFDLDDSKQFEHFQKFCNFKELEQLRRIGESTRQVVVCFKFSEANTLRYRQDPSVWRGRDEINPKPHCEVVSHYLCSPHDQLPLLIEACIEIQNDIKNEHDIDDDVKVEQKVGGWKLKGDTHWQEEALVDDQDEQADVPDGPGDGIRIQDEHAFVLVVE